MRYDLINYQKAYVFGAHSRGQTVGVYLRTLYSIEIEAYLYANEEDNPSFVNETPVLNLQEHPKLCGDYPVYIGTKGIYHKEIKSLLEALGMRTIIPVTPMLDMEWRNLFVKEEFRKTGRGFRKLGEVGDYSFESCIYVVRSGADSDFSCPGKTILELQPYERFILAGCALEAENDKKSHWKGCRDDTGSNISDRNRQFCELTALYWIWKNAKEDILGIEHYRRRFILEDDWKKHMTEEGVDVILPVPLYVAPHIKGNYFFRHDRRPWNAMLEVLRDRGDEYERARVFFEGTGCYSPCNMLIARREILYELCDWLFPILFQVAGRVGELQDAYQNRYPGFLSERLISFYFYDRSYRYRVRYADKQFWG